MCLTDWFLLRWRRLKPWSHNSRSSMRSTSLCSCSPSPSSGSRGPAHWAATNSTWATPVVSAWAPVYLSTSGILVIPDSVWNLPPNYICSKQKTSLISFHHRNVVYSLYTTFNEEEEEHHGLDPVSAEEIERDQREYDDVIRTLWIPIIWWKLASSQLSFST